MITLDTNVLVYARDERDPAKQATASAVTAVLAERGARIGLQCVGEFQVVIRRKLGLSAWVAAQEARTLLAAFRTFAPTETACLAALDLTATGRHGYWDSLLISSAAEAGFTVMLTEDIQATAKVSGLDIVNPFAVDGALSTQARELLDL